MPQSMRLMENRKVGYTKEQRLEAAKRKQEQQLSLAIIKELRELTGEPFDKLETYLKEEIPADIFKVESKSVLYRKVGSVDNELKSERTNLLKEHEGELRIRIIDTQIKNDKQNNKTLRLFCSYEVRTRHFNCRKIDKNNILTKDFLMNYVESMQNNTLGFPITSVLLTQKIIDDIDSNVTHLNVDTIEKIDNVIDVNTLNRTTIRVEQKSFSIAKFGAEIEDIDFFLNTLNKTELFYQEIAKNRVKEHRKMFIKSSKSKIKSETEIETEEYDENDENDTVSSNSDLLPITGQITGMAGLALTMLGGPLGLILGGTLLGVSAVTATQRLYGMPLNVLKDLAEEIDREEAESLEDVETDEDVSL